MKVIRIDTMPLTFEIKKSNDYCGKVVLSATADTLFKYDKETNSIVPNACEKIEYEDDFKVLNIYLKKNLYYYNGENITAYEYMRCFNEILKEKCYAYFIIYNIENITCKDKYILKITLKKPDIFFYKKLSVYNLSPTKEKLTSGPYYIKEINENNIIMTRNKYFREEIKNEKNKDICFEVSTEYIKDIELYNENKISITNNTMFPYNYYKKYKQNVTVRRNYIYMTLDFSPNYFGIEYDRFRNDIKDVIDKNEIVELLNNCHDSLDNFLFNIKEKNSKSNKIRKNTNEYSITVSLGYDEFYPNEMVVNLIKKQIEKIGIKVKLVKNVFGKINENDINLKLHYIPYMDDEAFYTSFLFCLLSGDEYKKKVDKYQLSGNRDILNYMVNYIDKKSYQIPILNMNGIYFIDNEMKEFNFVEFNYEDL